MTVPHSVISFSALPVTFAGSVLSKLACFTANQWIDVLLIQSIRAWQSTAELVSTLAVSYCSTSA